VTIRPCLIVAGIVAAVTALAGCTAQSSGSPKPGDTTTSTGSDPATTPTSVEPTGERPSEIILDGKDPCALIPQSDWPQLGIERQGSPSEDPTFKSPQCYFSGVGQVTVVVTEGVEAWDGRTQSVDITEADPIEGYPTITMWNKIDERSCYAAVDVADGQNLMTTAAPDPSNPEEPEACDLAYRMAISAISTLIAS